jgi:hypothetical protein
MTAASLFNALYMRAYFHQTNVRQASNLVRGEMPSSQQCQRTTGQTAVIACHVFAARQLAGHTPVKANLQSQLADFKIDLALICM